MSPVRKFQNEKKFKWLFVDLTFCFRSGKNYMSKKREEWLVGVWDLKNYVPSLYHLFLRVSNQELKPILQNKVLPVCLVDWCTRRTTRPQKQGVILDCINASFTRGRYTRRPTHRALKPRNCSGLYTWIVHAWEVFDQWTGALVD